MIHMLSKMSAVDSIQSPCRSDAMLCKIASVIKSSLLCVGLLVAQAAGVLHAGVGKAPKPGNGGKVAKQANVKMQPEAMRAAPTITSFTPASGVVGAEVTITGTNLTDATVSFNGAAVSNPTVTATSITATVPAGAITGPIIVSTAGGKAYSATSFTVSPPAPTITSFTPTTVSPGMTVTIVGTNFTGATAVSFCKTTNPITVVYSPSITVVSSTIITAVVPQEAVTGIFGVFAPGGAQASSSDITIAGTPTITGFSPGSGAATVGATPGTSVTISGTNLTGATVSFNGTAAVGPVVTATSITAVVPEGATTGPISVTTTGGTVLGASNFTVVQAPTFTSLHPSNGIPGTTVTFIGNNFTGATSVLFWKTKSPDTAVPAAGFTVVSPTVITAIVPVGAISGAPAIITPGGLVVTSEFRILGSQTITSFTPSSGGADTTVTILGPNCIGATAVKFNGVDATSFSAISSTAITAVVPPGAATGKISVVFPSGTAVSSTDFTVISVPTISAFTPTSGGVGATISLTGSGFVVGNTEVKFNGIASTSVNVASSNVLTAVVPTGATTGVIRLTTPGGTASSSSSFIVRTAPVVGSFSPASGAAGAIVTLLGSNFTGATAVKFNGVDATSFTVVSDTAITAVVPAGNVSGNISVVTPGGQGISDGAFTLLGAPTITGFTPDSGVMGGTVTISGANFINGATTVKFNGNASDAVTFVSGGAITATVPTGATTGLISVTTAAGTATSPSDFTVISVPVISAFSPASGALGSLVTITGANFTDATAVKFQDNQSAVFTVVNANTITATVPGAAATGPISITTPGGTVNTTNFIVLSAPTVASFTPSVGVVGTTVAITGTNLLGATSVKFNGIDATSYAVVSATSLTAVVPAGATTGPISVTTLGGSVNSADFTVTNAPTITNIAPSSGIVGDTVTLTGTNFIGATSVRFNGAKAITYNVASATSITAVVPPGASTGPITVTTDGGTVASTDFTVISAPTITNMSPSSDVVGAMVILTGTNFTGATAVYFNGVSASSFTVVTPTSMTVTVPAGAATGIVTVVTPGGTGTSAGNFTVNPAIPNISGFTPTSGGIGAMVTISGTSFTPTSAVAFNGVAADSVSYISPTSLKAVVAATTTTGTLTVTTVGGVATSVGSFTVVAAPTVDSLDTASGAIGATVVITGTNLTGASAVTFNGTPATYYVVNSATQITTKVPVGATTGNITVITAGGTSNGSAFTVLTAPVISNLSAATGKAGDTVVITGTAFTGTTAVKFSNNITATFVEDSATQITATVPTSATTGPISVTTPGGTALSATIYTVIPAPTISSFSPSVGIVGTTVTLTGANFTGATAVKFYNNQNATDFTVVNATTITAIVPPSAITGPISVATPGGTVNSNDFTVTVAPAITNFTPTSGLADDTYVTITGTNFTNVSSVNFGGMAATVVDVVSSTSIVAKVPAGASTGPITVVTLGGTATSNNFTVVAAPTVTNIDPASGIIGSTVTLTGTNFTGATAVKFNGISAITFTVDNATTITVVVPPGATTGAVSVTTPGGNGASAGNYTVKVAPVVGSLNPTSGPVGTTVAVTGSGFTGATVVYFNGIAGSGLTVTNDTTISVDVPAGAVSGKISVVTPFGVGTSSGSFTVTAAPTVTGFTPAIGGAGSTVVITGTNFTGATSVKFATNLDAASFTVLSSTSIKAVVPNGAVTGVIAITTPGGSVNSGAFTVVAAPTISSFTPTTGNGKTSVVITGTNFVTGETSVSFNGLICTSVTVDNATQLTVSVPTGVSTGKITVTTPGGTATSALNFTVVSAPTIANFSPTTGSVGTTVTITGTNFTGATAVHFNTTAVDTFTVVNATTITAVVKTGSATGPIKVTVPSGTVYSSSSFTMVDPPTVASFTPTSGGAGATITLKGTDYTGATAVKFNGVNATSFNIISSTIITAVVPSGATTGTLSVTTPSGIGTSAGSFTVVPPPVITSFSPANGGGVGTTVTITGTNFTGATAVKFYGLDATSFTVNSATEITAVVPVGATTGPISVSTPSGTGTSTSFTVIAAPTITGFTPSSGGIGSTVTITGTSFNGATSVKFNGTSSLGVTVVSSTTITATVPAGATTGKISITTPGGTASSSTSFTVLSAPTITSMAPNSGGVGATVTLIGTNFTGTNSIKFNGVSASTFTAISSTAISVVVPTGATTGTITVTTPNGTGTSGGNFTVVPLPTITSFTPASGGTGTMITLTGTNFTGTTAVNFNGVAGTNLSVVNDTLVTVKVPATSTTGLITLVTPSGNAISANNFTVVGVPTITSFAPTSGGLGASVTIFGTNLNGVSSIKFNGVESNTITAVSPTVAIAVVPTGASTGKISITTPGGAVDSTGLTPADFTLVSAPTLTSFTPASGGIGTTVTLTGTNFTNASSVKIGGVSASYTVTNATTIALVVPANAVSGTIQVVAPGGSVTSASNFTLLAMPAITEISPNSGAVGDTIILVGSNFTGVSAVNFTSAAAVSYTVISDSAISVTVPAGAATGPVSVTTTAGVGVSAMDFTIASYFDSLTSPAAVTAGEARQTASVMDRPGAKYLWTIENGHIEPGFENTAATCYTPGENGVCKLRCLSIQPDGTATLGVSTVDIVPAPRIESFDSSRTRIRSGEGVILTGRFEGGIGSIEGLGAIESGDDVVVNAKESKEYVLTVTNAAGSSVSRTISVLVEGDEDRYRALNQSVDAPEIEAFTASSLNIQSGEGIMLKATYKNGTASLNQGLGSIRSGQEIALQPETSTSYTLTVTNEAGQRVSRTLHIHVKAEPRTLLTTASTVTCGTMNFAAVPSASGKRFRWAIKGGEIEPGYENQPVVVYTAGSEGKCTLTCTILDGKGRVSSRTAQVDVLPEPVIEDFVVENSRNMGQLLLTGIFNGGVGSVDQGIGPVKSEEAISTPFQGEKRYTLTVTNAAGASCKMSLEVMAE